MFLFVLVGKIGAGKDEVANYLEKNYNCRVLKLPTFVKPEEINNFFQSKCDIAKPQLEDISVTTRVTSGEEEQKFPEGMEISSQTTSVLSANSVAEQDVACKSLNASGEPEAKKEAKANAIDFNLDSFMKNFEGSPFEQVKETIENTIAQLKATR